MASGGTRTWATSQPSAAFVLKCAKEQEKLRVKLQKQLQDHLLQLLEDGLFADVLVAVNDNKQHSIPCYQLADVSDQINKDPLSVVKAHRAILKVRVPALYNELCKQEVSTNDGKALRSYIGKTHLLSLLRKVYTEDDIRKSECEAVRLGKILSELSNDRSKAGLNKQIDSDLKDDADKASNGELYVTPTTSPLSPEKKENIARIFREHDSLSSRSKADKYEVNTNTSFQVDKICKTKDMNRSRETVTVAENNNNNIKYEPNINKKQAVKSFILPIQEQSNDERENLDSNKNSQMDDVTTDNNNSDSPSSGMVRSGTFDLQSQLPLEEALDTDPEQWDSQDGETPSLMKTSDDENMLSEEICPPKTQDSTRPFFLHRTTQLLKGEFSQESSSVERVRNLEHETQHSSPSRRLDVSVMSDSGFMSQSTFSLVSEAGLQCSLSSSLVTSLESGLSPSAIQGKEADESSSTSTSKNHKRSSSMFPFYIDIDSLTSDVANPKPAQQPTQSVYMYIDASNSKNNNKDIGDILDQEENHSYFRRKTSEPVSAKELYTKLTKVHSFPQLSNSADGGFMTCRCNNPDAYIKKRPQSCYMFIDLDSVETDTHHDEEKHLKKLSKAPSISMFIDLKDNVNDSVKDAQQTYNEFKNKCFSDGKQKSKDCDKIYPSSSDDKNAEVKESINSSPSSTILKALSDEEDANKKSSSECSVDSAKTSINIKQQICESFQTSSLSNFTYNTSSNVSVANPLGSLTADVFEGEVIPRDDTNKFVKETLTNSNELQHSTNEKILSENNSEKENTALHKNESPCKNIKNQNNTEIYTKKESTCIEQGEGLLPMSPILRRKEPKKEPPKPPPQPVVVKASTLPQDVDALTFRRPDKEVDDDTALTKKNRETEDQSTGSKFSSPLRTPKLPAQSKPATNNFESTKTGTVKQQQDIVESVGPITQQQSTHAVELSESFTSSNASSGLSSDKQSISDMLKERQLLSPPSWCELDDDSETIYSEVSDISSSFLGTLSCSSGQGKKSSREGQSPETDNGLSGSPSYRILQACSKLGEDLLKMFIEEIDADITIQVQEKEIKAHRCILVARCKYFAAVLKESWIESDGSTINLQGFSYPAVYFALCHIYSGAINFPNDVNIAEVALLADMLQLDTLKEVVVFHLKMNYCHFFHRPCSQCIQGVIECLHLAASCNLNELHEKCIRWLGKYFARTWPNKCFAALPEEIREECYQSTLPNLNVDNLIETILCCDRLIATLSHVKWTEPVYEMVTRLLQDCIYFMALHFDQMLTSDGFLALGKGQSWNVTSLEDSILSAVEILTPDNACRSYVKINEILSAAESENSRDIGQWTQNFIDLLHRIQRQCERFLIHNANHVVHCRNWALLAPEVQKRIKDAAIIVFEFEKPTAPPPRLSSLQRKLKKQKEGEDQSSDERFSTYPRKTKSLRGRKICRKGSEQSHPRSISHDEQLEREMNRKDRLEEEKKPTSTASKGSPAKVFQKPRRSVSSEAVIRHTAATTSQKNSGKLVGSSSEQNILNQKEAAHKVPNFPKVISEDFLKLKTLEDEDDASIKSESREETHCSKDVSYVSTHEKQTHSIHVAETKQKNVYMQSTRVAKSETSPTSSAISSEKSQSMTGKHRGKEEQNRYPRENKTESSSHSSQHTQFTTKSSQVAKVPPFTVKTDCKSPSTHCETFLSQTSPCNSAILDLSPVASTPDSYLRDQDSDGQKDLVAEIDADSSLVSHCLQEAEILEQELSRKLQRQQQASSAPPVSPAPASVCSVPKASGSGRLRVVGAHKSASLQKPSGLPSRERNHSGGSVRSCSTHSSHVVSKGIPKIDTQSRDQKGSSNRPALPRPITSNQRHYHSMESVATPHSRQTSSQVSTHARGISNRTRQRPSSTSRKYDARYPGTDANK